MQHALVVRVVEVELVDSRTVSEHGAGGRYLVAGTNHRTGRPAAPFAGEPAHSGYVVAARTGVDTAQCVEDGSLGSGDLAGRKVLEPGSGQVVGDREGRIPLTIHFGFAARVSVADVVNGAGGCGNAHSGFAPDILTTDDQRTISLLTNAVNKSADEYIG